MANKMPRLTPEQEDQAIDCVLEGHTLEGISCTLGLNGKRKLVRYLATYPDFMEKFQAALDAQCIDLEEQLLNVADEYGKDVARVKMESIARVLRFRNPKRYGDKTQIELNLTVDISKALERAEGRVIEATVISNVVELNGGKDKT